MTILRASFLLLEHRWPGSITHLVEAAAEIIDLTTEALAFPDNVENDQKYIDRAAET